MPHTVSGTESRATAPDLAAPSSRREPPRSSPSRLSPAPTWASSRWLAFLGLALAELVALWVRVGSVPSDAALANAAALVRNEWRPSDAVVIAPDWADPLLRQQLGDLMGVKVAAREDLAPFDRLWVLSLRGRRAPEAPPREPDFRRAIANVVVERYDLAPSPVLSDLVDALPNAAVEFLQEGVPVPCRYMPRASGIQRGGLGFGPAVPRARFVCGAGSGSTWVGTTVIEDLSLAPRRCVLTQPRPNEPVRIRYQNVPLGRELVLYAGLYYEDERNETGAPVTLRVYIDGRERAAFVHRDGDGMKRYVLEMQPNALTAGQAAAPARADLSLEIEADDNIRRSFCWAGSTRDAQRREAP